MDLVFWTVLCLAFVQRIGRPFSHLDYIALHQSTLQSLSESLRHLAASECVSADPSLSLAAIAVVLLRIAHRRDRAGA